MAGETPGAAKARRSKVGWNEDRSTNKVYASGNVSALGDARTVADSTLKPGQEPTPALNTPTVRADDKSADKYYAEGGSNRARPAAGTRRPQPTPAVKKLGPPPALGRPARPPFTILDVTDVNPVVRDAVARVKEGQEVTVTVRAGAADLLRRARTAVELAVTREDITEDQGRDIRFGYAAAPAAPPPPAPPAPPPAPKAPEDDPLAFLAGDIDADEEVDTTPQDVQEVDTTNDPAPAAPEPAAAAEDDDGADNAFLDPAAQAAVAENPTVPAGADQADRHPTDAPVRVQDPEPEVVADPTAGTRRKNRRGRGE